MKKASLFVAFAFLAAAGPAAPQTQQPAPAAKEERPAAPQTTAPRPPLNLKLDNPSQYTTESPRQKTDGLPALGADARPLPADAPNAVVPKDWQRER